MTQKPRTVLSHGKLPYPAGTLVMDTVSGRTGQLVGVLEEHGKESGRLVSEWAYIRPVGGGIEWDAPLTRVRPVESR